MKTSTSVAIAGLLAAQGALAAGIDPAANGVSPGSWNLFDGRSKTSIGLGAAYVPSYEGADEHEWRALPLVDIQRGRFFFGTTRGIGVDLSSNPSIQFGPRLGYRRGRDENDSSHLHGLGDIDSGLEAGAFFRMKLDAWFVHGDMRTGVGNATDGIVARLGGGRNVQLTPSDQVVVDASIDWADRKYTATYFGVTADQAAASGLTPYSAGAGIKSYGASATLIHSFSGGWFSSLGVRLGRLTGDAADSPIVERETQIMGSAALGYRF